MDWHAYIPFAAMVSNKLSQERRMARPLVTRIIELTVIGTLSTGIGIYANDIRLTDRMDSMAAKLAEVSIKLDKMQNDLYQPRVMADQARLKAPK